MTTISPISQNLYTPPLLNPQEKLPEMQSNLQSPIVVIQEQAPKRAEDVLPQEKIPLDVLKAQYMNVLKPDSNKFNDVMAYRD